MNRVIEVNSVIKLAVIDLVLLGVIYLLPAIAHYAPFPLYFIDPMRLLLLVGFIISKNKNNTLFLAATMPLISTLISGHPVFAKSILISMELVCNIWILVWLLRTKIMRLFPLLVLSILASKVVYYFFKYVFIQLDYIKGDLISTPIWLQLSISCGIAVMFSLLLRNRNFLDVN